jgi:ParB family chromosome partitioning protein
MGEPAALDPSDFVIIGLDTKDGKEHVLYDERINLPLDEAMVLNIMELGVQMRVLVRRVGNSFEVIDGRRRVMHAREANNRLVRAGKPPLLIRFDRAANPEKLKCETKIEIRRAEEKRFATMMLSLNEIRKDDSPLKKADKLIRYIDMGHDEDAAAITFGVNVGTIKAWLKLAQLSTHVRKLVDRGEISASAAAKFADMTDSEQNEAADKLIASGEKPTAKAAEKAKKSKDTNGEGATAPGKRLVSKVLKVNEAEKDDEGQPLLSSDFVRGVRWVIGDISDTHIKGLRYLIEQASKRKTAKAEAAE